MRSAIPALLAAALLATPAAGALRTAADCRVHASAPPSGPEVDARCTARSEDDVVACEAAWSPRGAAAQCPPVSLSCQGAGPCDAEAGPLACRVAPPHAGCEGVGAGCPRGAAECHLGAGPAGSCAVSSGPRDPSAACAGPFGACEADLTATRCVLQVGAESCDIRIGADTWVRCFRGPAAARTA